MPEIQNASPWRVLFAADAWPDCHAWPAVLAPLQDAFARLGTDPEPRDTKAWQPNLARALLQLDLPPWRVSQLLSDHNDWLYRRAIRDALAQMTQQGWGAPPCGFCVLTLGSGARHESLLGPDQDNAMIIEDYPDARHMAIDTWFQSLGERFTARLDGYGIPLCNGHVMARWPSWRKRSGEWQQQLQLWTAGRIVKRVQLSNILLDFAPVYGDGRLAATLSTDALALMPHAGLFLHEMATLLHETPVALDRFERLHGNDRDAPHGRALNLKAQGLLVLQGAARLLALLHGVAAVDTRGRLAALADRNVLTATRSRRLIEALNHLQALLLQSHLEAMAAGRAPDAWIDLNRLDDAARALLRQDLLAIRDCQRLACGAV